MAEEIEDDRLSNNYFILIFDSIEKLFTCVEMLKFSQFCKTNFTIVHFSLKLQEVEYYGTSQSKYFDMANKMNYLFIKFDDHFIVYSKSNILPIRSG